MQESSIFFNVFGFLRYFLLLVFRPNVAWLSVRDKGC